MSIPRRRDALSCACLLLLPLLTACGGGSSSPSSGSSPVGGAGGSTLPPPIPQPIYNGTTASADIQLGDAQNWAQVVFLALQFMNSNSRSLLVNELAPGDYTYTGAGSGGGQVVQSGHINLDFSGWVEDQYINYVIPASKDYPEAVVNGDVIYFQDQAQSGVHTSGTLGFSHYSEQVAGTVYGLDGNLKYFEANGGERLTGNLTLEFGRRQMLIAGMQLDSAG